MALKDCREFDTMRYPLTSVSGDWYISSETMKGSEEETKMGQMGPKVLLVLRQQGQKSYRILSSIPFEDTDFSEKWLSMVYQSKKIVDALNINPEEIAPKQALCAECGEPTLDDYLCQECRAKNE